MTDWPTGKDKILKDTFGSDTVDDAVRKTRTKHVPASRPPPKNSRTQDKAPSETMSGVGAVSAPYPDPGKVLKESLEPGPGYDEAKAIMEALAKRIVSVGIETIAEADIKRVNDMPTFTLDDLIKWKAAWDELLDGVESPTKELGW